MADSPKWEMVLFETRGERAREFAVSRRTERSGTLEGGQMLTGIEVSAEGRPLKRVGIDRWQFEGEDAVWVPTRSIE